VALKKSKIRGLKFCDAESAEVVPDPVPGELALPFGDPGQQESQDADLDVSLNPRWQPVMHGGQLDLGGF
jgi:hypothetical protein